MPGGTREAVRDAEDSEMAFAVFWAQKESYLKWSGEGITRNLSELSMENAVMEEIPIERLCLSGLRSSSFSMGDHKITGVTFPYLTGIKQLHRQSVYSFRLLTAAWTERQFFSVPLP